jgi:hypothetical protein
VFHYECRYSFRANACQRLITHHEQHPKPVDGTGRAGLGHPFTLYVVLWLDKLNGQFFDVYSVWYSL